MAKSTIAILLLAPLAGRADLVVPLADLARGDGDSHRRASEAQPAAPARDTDVTLFSSAHLASFPSHGGPFGPALWQQATYAAASLAPAGEHSSDSLLAPARRPGGSTAAVAWVLGALAAVQALCARRKACLSAIPEWYHAHARPVGHSTPISLDADCVALPVRPFERPPVVSSAFRCVDEPLAHPPSRFLQPAIPRGPPCA